MEETTLSVAPETNRRSKIKKLAATLAAGVGIFAVSYVIGRGAGKSVTPTAPE